MGFKYNCFMIKHFTFKQTYTPNHRLFLKKYYNYKKNIYEKSGVKEYWILDPIQKILEIYSNKENKFFLQSEYKQTDIAKSPLIQDLEINLAEVF